MKAICADGTEIDCENFKAIDRGVLLTKDRKRNKVIGFVPNDDLRYIVPDDAETEHRREIENQADGVEHTDGKRQASERERSGERERKEIAALRERLDRLEARVDLSGPDHAEHAGRSVSTATIEEQSRDAETEHGSEPGTDDRLDAPDPAETVAEETRAEPTPDSETELLSGSSDAESGEEKQDGSEHEAIGSRTTAATTEANAEISTDTNTGTETETESGQIGASGFDPVAVVAEQREHEGSDGSTERSESEPKADDETIDIGRSDPVATIARQGGDSTAQEIEVGETNETDSGAAEPASSTGDDREEETEPRTELQRIDGLGPTYADRLAENGIETLSDLEGADPENMASIAEVSESRAEEWIEQAGELPA